MSEPTTLPWPEANERYLLAAVDVVRAAVEHRAARLSGHTPEDRSAAVLETLETAGAAMPGPAALDRLCAIFGLSAFERGVILLGVGLETDASFGSLCAAAQGDPQRTFPTFRLALDTLPGGRWGALSPQGSLRRWRLLEIGPGHALGSSALRLAERVLHFLFGADPVDERLAGLIEPLAPAVELVPSHRVLAERLAALWETVRDAAAFPLVELSGGDAADRRAVAAYAAALLGREARALPAGLLPAQPKDLEPLKNLWELESALSGAALVIEDIERRENEQGREEALLWFASRIWGPVMVSGAERLAMRHRPVVTLEVEAPSASEQRELWRSALGEAAVRLDGRLDQITTQFQLGAPAVRAAAIDALARLEAVESEAGPGAGGDAEAPDATLAAVLWEACRSQARPRLDDLAQRIDPAATWEDLVLPEPQRQVLREVAMHVRQRLTVYERWGFAEKGRRGLGISALFAGSSGTGKTMAAEVLASDLRLDLYRIDLSAVISKYIGETEKNLRRVFDAAEAGGAILLFDEADALFGKRTAVQDSHDRHANIEVSYLLQRMEAYRGLAILTTNMRSALDGAFLRRLRFIVDFPFPDADQRAEIWRRIFPAETPSEGVDPEKLARLNVTGGNIRNIALNAAFLAAEAGGPVKMEHLLRAARSEYGKLKKTLNPIEIRGWDVV